MHSKNASWYWIGLLILVGALGVYAERYDLYGLYLGYNDSKEEVHIMQDRLVQVTLEKNQLDENIAGMDSDPLLMEAAVRRNTGQVRRGETVYRVELPSDSTP